MRSSGGFILEIKSILEIQSSERKKWEEEHLGRDKKEWSFVAPLKPRAGTSLIGWHQMPGLGGPLLV